MKNLFLALTMSVFCSSAIAQSTVNLKGNIGKYSIEMELEPSADKNGNVKGKYRYAGKTAYMDLEGDYLSGEILYLQESWDGKVTGSFYLTHSDENTFTGKWIGTKSVMEAKLTVTSGEINDLISYTLESYSALASDEITGSYVSEYYFINDMWYTEDNPSLEIGFNGGVVTAQQKGADSVQVYFNLICGPTYHFAYFSGTAWKIGESKYKYRGSMDPDEEACELIFEFKSGSVDITQESSSFACGFGARAYAEGSFGKVNDKAIKGEDLSIEDVLPD
jgi:hypothetical protein